MSEYLQRHQDLAAGVLHDIFAHLDLQGRQETQRAAFVGMLRTEIEDLTRDKAYYREPNFEGTSYLRKITPPVHLEIPGIGLRKISVGEIVRTDIENLNGEEVATLEEYRVFATDPETGKATPVYGIPRVGQPIGWRGQTLDLPEVQGALTIVRFLDQVLPLANPDVITEWKK